EIIPKRDIITEEMVNNCISNAGLDYEVFKEDLHKSALKESLQVDLHIAREMEIEEAPSLVFFNEDIQEEGLKVEIGRASCRERVEMSEREEEFRRRV